MVAYGHNQVKTLRRQIHFQFTPLPHKAGLPTRSDGRCVLSLGERVLFAEIIDHAKSRGWICRLTNRQLATRLEVSVATVRRGLDAVQAAGLIDRTYSHGGRVRVGIVVVWDGVAQQPTTSPSAPVAQARPTGCAPPADRVAQPRAASIQSPGTRSDFVASTGETKTGDQIDADGIRAAILAGVQSARPERLVHVQIGAPTLAELHAVRRVQKSPASPGRAVASRNGRSHVKPLGRVLESLRPSV